MKLSTGRGIQFFKKPFFVNHKKYAQNIYKSSKNNLDKVYQNILGKKK